MNVRHGRMDEKSNQRRIFQGHIRAVEIDGQPGVTLKIVRYNVVDDFGSVWAPGSVLEGLRERLPQLVRQHDRSIVIGRAVEGFDDDGDGQIVNFRFANFDRVPAANEAHSLVEDGIIDECSVGFRWEYEFHTPDQSELERWPGASEIITRAFCSEVSLVMEGAVPGARVLAVREKPLQILTLQKREPKMINVDDAARIYNAAIEKMQGGASGTEVLIAGLQDLQSLTIESETPATPENPEEPEGDPTPVGPGGEEPEQETPPVAAQAGENEDGGEENITGETQEPEAEKPAGEDGGEDGSETPPVGDEVEEIDEELQTLLAEVDDLLIDRDDVWVPVTE